MPTNEVSIQAAVADFNAGIFKSMRAAASAYGIPRSTLRDRIRGATSATASHAYQQRLTPEQEDFLVDWILEQDTCGHPPSRARTREMATRILAMGGDTRPLGQLWVANFIRRNPRVKSVIGRKLEACRAEAATPEQLRAFLETIERIRISMGIRVEDIRNMDETSVALGVGANSRALASISSASNIKTTCG